MTPIRLKLEFLLERGAITSLLGVDTRTGDQCALHIDQRPWAEISADLRSTHTPPVLMAEGLELAVTFELAAEERAA